MTDKLSRRPVKKKDVAVQSMPPDTIILNLDNGFYYSTNRIGSAVIALCDGSLTLADIIRKISDDCVVSEDQVQEDVLAFIADMTKEGLVALEPA